MTPMEFAQLWRNEKNLLIDSFLSTGSGSAVAAEISKLGLSPSQVVGLRRVVDGVLTDTMYTLLLGLDGCAGIGGRQETYKVFSESGDQLSGDGELEAAAWEVFHNPEKAEPLGEDKVSGMLCRKPHPENHDVEGQSSQDDFATLRPIVPGA